VSRFLAFDPDSIPRHPAHAQGVKGWGDLLFVSAQTGRDREGRMVSDDLAPQFARALENALDVVWAAGGGPESVTQLRVYLTDLRDYRRRRKGITEAWERQMKGHRPALTIVEVNALLDEEAQVAIEAEALV
jgi:enamine deaminase RidA (YjgF/YER057c/UK114 family)